jgi:hypothetical protein
MIAIRRAASAGVVVAAALLVPSASTGATSASQLVGHLAYVTSAGDLDVVDVNSDGTTSPPQRLGPVTTAQPPDTVKATNVVVSADGTRLAWSEVVSKPDPTYGSLETSAEIVIHNMTTGQNAMLRSENYLLGFADHTLVVVSAHAKRVVLTPTPHFEPIHDGNAYPVATYTKGLVDVAMTVNSKGTIETDHLRLTTFSGHHALLHTYKVGRTYRSAAANIDAVSPDGQKLLVELGNHQDFDGLGPSSTFDTYSMRAGPARRQLGHYGTNAAKWRLVSTTFVGPHDTPWLALHSGYSSASSSAKVRGVVVRYVSGHWAVVSSAGVAVAGNNAGWAVVQSGSWQPVMNSPDGEYQPVASGQAFLIGPAESHLLPRGVGGTQLLWVG